MSAAGNNDINGAYSLRSLYLLDRDYYYAPDLRREGIIK